METNALIDFSNLQRVLEDFAKDIRENYISELQSHDRVASGELINSIRTNVIAGDRIFEVTMTLKDYWKYIENDTKPHWPPVNAILNWIKIKPVIPRPGDNGKIPTQKQLAYLISRKISIKGTKGSHDLKITKDNILPWYRERILEALAKDTGNYLRNVIVEE